MTHIWKVWSDLVPKKIAETFQQSFLTKAKAIAIAIAKAIVLSTMVDDIIAFKAMAQNMTADDWFLPKKSALDWYGSKSKKYGPDC